VFSLPPPPGFSLLFLSPPLSLSLSLSLSPSSFFFVFFLVCLDVKLRDGGPIPGSKKRKLKEGKKEEERREKKRRKKRRGEREREERREKREERRGDRKEKSYENCLMPSLTAASANTFRLPNLTPEIFIILWLRKRKGEEKMERDAKT